MLIENLINTDANNVIKIGKFAMEFTHVSNSYGGVREYTLQTKFKNIYGISLTSITTEGGEVRDEQMLQLLHSWNEQTGKIRIYSKSNQTVGLIVVGTT